MPVIFMVSADFGWHEGLEREAMWRRWVALYVVRNELQPYHSSYSPLRPPLRRAVPRVKTA